MANHKTPTMDPKELLAETVQDKIDELLEDSKEGIIGEYNSDEFIEVWNRLKVKNSRNTSENDVQWRIIVYVSNVKKLSPLDLTYITTNIQTEYIPSGGKVTVALLHAETADRMVQTNHKNNDDGCKLKYPGLMVKGNI